MALLGQRSVVSLLISLALAGGVASAAAAQPSPAVSGTKCSRAGATQVVRGITYKCARSGKSLSWKAAGKAPSSGGSAGSSSGSSGSSGSSRANEPWYFEIVNWDTPSALPRSPACTEQYPLKVNPAPISSYASLNRLGYTQPGAHALPVPHHNVSTRDIYGSGQTDERGYLLVSERLDIVAPADLTMVGLARNIYSRHVRTGQVYNYEEWMLSFHVCGTKYVVFNHIDDVPTSWLTTAKSSGAREECNTGQDNASVCMWSPVNIAVKQGSRLGRASGRSVGWDIGAWDTSRPAPGVMDPGKFTGRWSMEACVWDWFTPSIKAEVFAKFVGDKTSCGTTGHDVAGTLSGNWLAVGQRSRAAREDLHVALIPSYKNDGSFRFSIGYDSNISSLPGGIYEFTAEGSGLRNPRFSSVQAGQVACFDTFSSLYGKSDSITRIFATMQTGATEKLTIAGATGGTCGSGPYTMPSGATTFERINKTTG